MMNKLFLASAIVLLYSFSTAATAQDGTDLYNSAKEAYADADYSKAIDLAKESASQGSSEAMILLGDIYLAGNGIPQPDPQEALNWYMAADAQDNNVAQYKIGNMYYDGHGVNQSFPDAAAWFEKAAQSRDLDANERDMAERLSMVAKYQTEMNRPDVSGYAFKSAVYQKWKQECYIK